MWEHCSHVAILRPKYGKNILTYGACNKNLENDPKMRKKMADAKFFYIGKNFGTFYNYRSLDAIFGLFELGEIVASAFWNF